MARRKTVCLVGLVLFAGLLCANSHANLARNPSFEDGYYPWGTNNSFVAYEWTPFNLQGYPQYLRSSFECINGVTSQQVWSDGVPFLSGIHQQISGVTPNAFYKMTAWTLTIWHGTGSPRADGHMKRRIGIDPYGGTNPSSANIVWSDYNLIDKQWKQLTVTATARASTITIFFWLDDLDNGSQDQFFCDAVIVDPVAGVIINNVQATNITSSTATISWTTNVNSTSRVDYGTTTSYGSNVYNGTLATNHAMTLTGLDPGTTYHYRVTSTASGYETGVSPDYTFTTTNPPSMPISQAKAQPDGNVVTLANKTVTVGTELFTGTFYIEDQNRSSGIKVYAGSTGPTADTGDGVEVTGTLSTSSGERQLISPTVTTTLAGYPIPDPVSMPTRAVGGGSLNDYTPGVFGGVGVHNTGLLVQTWGRVMYVDIAGKLFYMDDGCALENGSGYIGLMVHCGGTTATNTITLPSPGSYVKVIGISSRRSVSGSIVPVVRPRRQSDIVVVQAAP